MTELKLKDDRKEKSNRAPLSPKLRYNVLRRDGFTCQYCGRTGQERELEIDHIVPVSKGGTNDIGNLQTSCKECNRGKLADELITQYTDIKIVGKVVIKEVPIEKIVYEERPQIISTSNTFGWSTPDKIYRWALDESNPELASACRKIIDARKDVSSKEYPLVFRGFAQALTNSGKPMSKTCAENEMKINGDNIKKWAKQDNDPLLKALAMETLRTVGLIDA